MTFTLSVGAQTYQDTHVHKLTNIYWEYHDCGTFTLVVTCDTNFDLFISGRTYRHTDMEKSIGHLQWQKLWGIIMMVFWHFENTYWSMSYKVRQTLEGNILFDMINFLDRIYDYSVKSVYSFLFFIYTVK